MKKHYMSFFILLLILVTGEVYYAHSAITPIEETGYSTPTPRANSSGNTNLEQQPDIPFPEEPIFPDDPDPDTPTEDFCAVTSKAQDLDYACSETTPYCDPNKFPVTVNHYVSLYSTNEPNSVWMSNFSENASETLKASPFDLWACCFTYDNNNNNGDSYFGCTDEADGRGLPLFEDVKDNEEPTCTDGSENCLISTYYNQYNIKAIRKKCNLNYYSDKVPLEDISSRECCLDNYNKDYYCKPDDEVIPICNFTDKAFFARIKADEITNCRSDIDMKQDKLECRDTGVIGEENTVTYCRFQDDMLYTYCDFDNYYNNGKNAPIKDYVDLTYDEEKAENPKKEYIPCNIGCDEGYNSCAGYRYAADEDYCSTIRKDILIHQTINLEGIPDNYVDLGYIPKQTDLFSSENDIHCLNSFGYYSNKPFSDCDDIYESGDDNCSDENGNEVGATMRYDQYTRACVGYYTEEGCSDLGGIFDTNDICPDLTEKDFPLIDKFHKCSCPDNYISYQEVWTKYEISDYWLKQVDSSKICKAECTGVDLANDYLACYKFDQSALLWSCEEMQSSTPELSSGSLVETEGECDVLDGEYDKFNKCYDSNTGTLLHRCSCPKGYVTASELESIGKKIDDIADYDGPVCIADCPNGTGNGSCEKYNIELFGLEECPKEQYEGIIQVTNLSDEQNGWYATRSNGDQKFVCIKNGEPETYYKYCDLSYYYEDDNATYMFMDGNTIIGMCAYSGGRSINGLCNIADWIEFYNQCNCPGYKTKYYMCNNLSGENYKKACENATPDTEHPCLLATLNDNSQAYAYKKLTCDTSTYLKKDDWIKNNEVSIPINDYIFFINNGIIKNNENIYEDNFKGIADDGCVNVDVEYDEENETTTIKTSGDILYKKYEVSCDFFGSSIETQPDIKCSEYETKISCVDENNQEVHFCACSGEYIKEIAVPFYRNPGTACTFNGVDYYKYGGNCPADYKGNGVTRSNNISNDAIKGDYGAGITIESCYNTNKDEEAKMVYCDPTKYKYACTYPYVTKASPSSSACRRNPDGKGSIDTNSPLFFGSKPDLVKDCTYAPSKCGTQIGGEDITLSEYEIYVLNKRSDCAKLYGTGAKVEECNDNGELKYNCYYKANEWSYNSLNCSIGHDFTGPYVLKDGKKYYNRCDCPAIYKYHTRNCTGGKLSGRVCIQENVDQEFKDSRPYDTMLQTLTSVRNYQLYTQCSGTVIGMGGSDDSGSGDAGSSGGGAGGSGDGAGSSGGGAGGSGDGAGSSGDGAGGSGGAAGSSANGAGSSGDDGDSGDGDGTGGSGEGTGGSGEGTGGSGGAAGSSANDAGDSGDGDSGSDGDAGSSDGDAGSSGDAAGSSGGDAGSSGNGAGGSGTNTSTWATCYYCCPSGTSPTGKTRQGTKGREFECK